MQRYGSVIGLKPEGVAEYERLHDHFGRGANRVMHRLREIKRRAVVA